MQPIPASESALVLSSQSPVLPLSFSAFPPDPPGPYWYGSLQSFLDNQKTPFGLNINSHFWCLWIWTLANTDINNRHESCLEWYWGTQVLVLSIAWTQPREILSGTRAIRSDNQETSIKGHGHNTAGTTKMKGRFHC